VTRLAGSRHIVFRHMIVNGGTDRFDSTGFTTQTSIYWLRVSGAAGLGEHERSGEDVGLPR
jgi:hypothetical protein